MTKKKLINFLLTGYSHSPGFYVAYVSLMLAFGLTVPIFIELQKRIIDLATDYSTHGQILPLLVPFLIGYLVFYYLDTVSVQVATLLQTKIMHQVEQKVMHQYLHNISKLVFPAYEDSEIQNRLMRVSSQQRQLYAQGVSFFPNIFRRVMELGGIFYFVAQAGVWWAFPLGILISLPSFYFNKKRTLLARQVWVKDSQEIRYTEYLNETLLNREVAKERRFFGFFNYLSELWTEKFKDYNHHKISAFIKSSVATGVAMCFSMSIILILGVALLSPLQVGTITIGLYTSILIAVASKMNMGISAVVREYSNLANFEHFLADLQVLDQVEKVNNSQPVQKNEGLTFESIVFDNVWFAYPNTEQYILKGVSFEIRKNQRHALIGINGAGKTTITKLMLGFYSPTRGKIYLNGQEINTYSQSQIQSIFAAVQQSFAKYKDSLAENLSLYEIASQEPDHDRLNQTLARCETSDLLSKCKNDYTTLLTPEFSDGIMLSGGEWQKISISRAFYSQRDFIIFDEPTAALDPRAEVRFYETYHRIMAGHTCLFITHRLGSTFLFENCLVLSDGKIVEQGSQAELMQQNGVYKELYDKQRDWYQEKEVG